MSGLAALGNYIDSGSDEEDNAGSGAVFEINKAESAAPLHLSTAKKSGVSSLLSNPVVAAPSITLNASLDQRRHLDPTAKEIKYNPK